MGSICKFRYTHAFDHITLGINVKKTGGNTTKCFLYVFRRHFPLEISTFIHQGRPSPKIVSIIRRVCIITAPLAISQIQPHEWLPSHKKKQRSIRTWNPKRTYSAFSIVSTTSRGFPVPHRTNFLWRRLVEVTIKRRSTGGSDSGAPNVATRSGGRRDRREDR